MSSSLFKKVAEANPTRGGVYPLPGQYVVRIEALREVTSFRQIACFIAEFYIVTSTNKERPAGSSMSWVAAMDKPSAPGNVSAFYQALFPEDDLQMGPDLSPEQIAATAQALEATVGPDNPCRGEVLFMEAATITTRAGKPFTKCMFRALSAEERAEIDAPNSGSHASA